MENGQLMFGVVKANVDVQCSIIIFSLLHKINTVKLLKILYNNCVNNFFSKFDLNYTILHITIYSSNVYSSSGSGDSSIGALRN